MQPRVTKCRTRDTCGCMDVAQKKGPLASWRAKLGLTQMQLAKRSGISRATICRLESRPGCELKSRTLMSLAKALDCTTQDLLNEP